MNKFSIGLTLLASTKEEWFKIIDKYHNSISYIYYSPNINGFFSRGLVFDVTELDDSEQYDVLNYARSKGIQTELAINTNKDFNKDDLSKILYDERAKHIPDSIVTYSRFLDTCINVFPECKYTLSYNEGIRHPRDIEKIDKRFTSIILGNRWIRDRSMFETVKENGFEVELLVNNGCSHNCQYCFTDGKCQYYFNMNIARYDINVITAINTIFPFELSEYELWGIIDNYKLSTRPHSYEMIVFLLESFINKNNLDNLFINNNSEHVDSIFNLKHYRPFYSFINMSEVVRIKKDEWNIVNERYKNISK